MVFILLLQNKFIKLNNGDRVTASGKVDLVHALCFWHVLESENATVDRFVYIVSADLIVLDV